MKTLLKYGAIIAAVTIVVQAMEYAYVVRTLSFKVYATMIGIGFLAFGMYLGLRVARRRRTPSTTPPTGPSRSPDRPLVPVSGHRYEPLTRREQDVLKLMASGHSNQQIADILYISLATVKTHVNKVYQKFQVQRRTQAVAKWREMGE